MPHCAQKVQESHQINKAVNNMLMFFLLGVDEEGETEQTKAAVYNS